VFVAVPRRSFNWHSSLREGKTKTPWLWQSE
jgi:hypothetical protein